MRIRHRRICLYIVIVLVFFTLTSCSAKTGAPDTSAPPSPAEPIAPPVTEPELSSEISGTPEEPSEEAPAQSPEESPEGTPEETPEESPEESPEETGEPEETEPAEPKPTKVAYLTIDDGPSRAITPAILDLLAEEEIKASFFVLPHNGVDDIYQRIIYEGHELANHSYSHVYSKLYDIENLEAFREDVLAARDFIYDKFGYVTVAFRFPGGSMGRSEEITGPRKEILAELGYRWFDWHLTTGDADSSGSGKNASILTANVLDNLKDRSHAIILMHDTSDKKATLEALPVIIAGLRERGYTFDLISNYPEK